MSGDVGEGNPRRDVKVVVVGDGAVGKTCLCNVFVNRVFPLDYEPTIFENHAQQMNVADQVIFSLLCYSTFICFVDETRMNCSLYKV